MVATDTPQTQTGGELDRFTIFAFLWAVATLFHQFSFKSWISHSELLGWLLTSAALLLTFCPRSILIWAMMLVLSILYTLQRSPFVANHILFECFVNVTMLLVLAHTIMHRWSTSQPKTLVQFSRELRNQSVRHELFEGFAAPIRIELLVL